VRPAGPIGFAYLGGPDARLLRPRIRRYDGNRAADLNAAHAHEVCFVLSVAAAETCGRRLNTGPPIPVENWTIRR
jgi:hypothetical protein